MQIKIKHTNLEGLIVISPRRICDNRGYFEETWSRRAFVEAGIDVDFVQDNHSASTTVGVLRGLHFQAPPHAQDKLVRCTRGAIFDVAVDVRLGSPSYGQWAGIELTPENGRQLFIPKGFLHGFVALKPDTDMQYKCSDYYASDFDGSVRWDSLGIDWPIHGTPILSAKDANAVSFAEFKSPFV